MSGTGAIIMSLFAAIWWIAGMYLSGYGQIATYAVGPVLAVAIVAIASRAPKATIAPEEEARQGRLVGIASGVEGLAILVAVNVCTNMTRPDLISPAIAAIVGLHFIPLAHGLPAPFYYGTCGLLLVVSGIGLEVVDPLQRVLVVTVGAACVLWLTSAALLGRLLSSAARNEKG